MEILTNNINPTSLMNWSYVNTTVSNNKFVISNGYIMHLANIGNYDLSNINIQCDYTSNVVSHIEVTITLVADSRKITLMCLLEPTSNTFQMPYSMESGTYVSNIDVKIMSVGTISISRVSCDVTLSEQHKEIVVIKETMAEFNNVLAGNITAENIKAESITSDKLIIEDGFIDDAMINTVKASKIVGEQLSTNNITIGSADGGILIADNTQQFRDAAGNVRIQMGQDAAGNFTFMVIGEDGTTTLIDGYGVKEGAIADNLIKNRMIGTGEIAGEKIDIDSLLTSINEDAGTMKLSGTKVYLDTAGQTLEIAFKEMETTVHDAVEKLPYMVEILSTNGGVFKNGDISTTLYAIVKKGTEDITHLIDASRFVWTRTSEDTSGDTIWNQTRGIGRKQLTITNDDVIVKATFKCEILE